MATWRKYFNSSNSGLPVNLTGQNSDGYSTTHTRYSSWLPEVYAGSPNRLMRYVQYDQMDNDLEINAALDILAEFSTQDDDTTEQPFTISFNEDPSETEMKILSKTLEQWCNLNDMRRRAFKMFRSTLKYGDQFFIRDPETKKWFHVDPAKVTKIIVNESTGKTPEQYIVKDINFNFKNMVATTPYQTTGNVTGGGSGYLTGGARGYVGASGHDYATSSGSRFSTGMKEIAVDSEHVVHLSLSEGLDNNFPFGNSLLEAVFKVFKQKEFLESKLREATSG